MHAAGLRGCLFEAGKPARAAQKKWRSGKIRQMKDETSLMHTDMWFSILCNKESILRFDRIGNCFLPVFAVSGKNLRKSSPCKGRGTKEDRLGHPVPGRLCGQRVFLHMDGRGFARKRAFALSGFCQKRKGRQIEGQSMRLRQAEKIKQGAVSSSPAGERKYM